MRLTDLLIDLVVLDQLVRNRYAFLGGECVGQVLVPVIRVLVGLVLDASALVEVIDRHHGDGAIVVALDDVLIGALLCWSERRQGLKCGEQIFSGNSHRDVSRSLAWSLRRSVVAY